MTASIHTGVDLETFACDRMPGHPKLTPRACAGRHRRAQSEPGPSWDACRGCEDGAARAEVLQVEDAGRGRRLSVRVQSANARRKAAKKKAKGGGE